MIFRRRGAAPPAVQVQASGAGAVAIGGDSYAPITVTVTQSPPARSQYLEQVRLIAPPELLGRKTELAALTRFCTAKDTSSSYLWWRGPAWAGKSALMAWFVLHPPVGVQLVSFFITARYAGQSDRVAFVDVVVEQLAELLGEPLPSLTDATRDAHLRGLLSAAAAAAQQRDRRLVLVVDGLDEDRGVTAGPDAYSIAALLPTQPPAGMRIVVAGRPNPPIPTDVPPRHPLRDTRIVRELSRSPHAAVVRHDAQRELKRLLHGADTERDLLGLLTAAGGGLSGADLAELTGEAQREIEEHLHAVSGRTFARRTGRWHNDTQVYLLGHEELQQEAIRFLGHRLEAYRQRLHTWAEGYRARHWPPGTSEYLLRGYFRLLQGIGDTTRMLLLATDLDRHDRMLSITGGDYAALTEILTTGQAILATDNPRLAARVDSPSTATSSLNATATPPFICLRFGRNWAIWNAPSPLPAQ